MELPIFNSNKRQLLFEVAFSFSLLLLVACSPENPAPINTNSGEAKGTQQIDIFQAPLEKNEGNRAFKISDLKLVGVLIAASGENSAVISVGSAGQVSTYRVGDEVSQGVSIVSISTDEVMVSDKGNNFRIAMPRAVKSDQNSLGKLSQSEPSGSTTSNSLPPGMVPMSPSVDTRPSANNEFRDAVNQRFPK